MTYSSPALDCSARNMETALADLKFKMRTLDLSDPRRGRIAQQIVTLEDEIERRRATGAGC